MRSRRKQIFFLLISLLLIGMGIFVYRVGSQWNFHQPKKEYKIEMIIKTITDDNDFWPVVMEGAIQASKDYNSKIIINGPAQETDIERQNQLIKEAIERKPDLMIIAPADYTLSTEMVRAVKAANIPLVLLDSRIEENIQDIFVGTDNVEAGRKIGELLKSVDPMSGGKVGIISHVATASSAIGRKEGLMESLKGRYEILEPYYSDSNQNQARERTLELIKEHPDVRVLIGLNEWSSVGMAKAVKELHKNDEIIVLGFDNSREEAKLLEEGSFQGIVIQKAFNMGYLSVENGVKKILGQKVEEEIDSGSSIITKENMYSPENEKLMFRFSE